MRLDRPGSAAPSGSQPREHELKIHACVYVCTDANHLEAAVMTTLDPGRTVQQHEMPEEICSLAALDSDYADLFVATTSGARRTSPEQCARAAMEGAHPAGRFLSWRLVLRLRLASGQSAHHIAGRTIIGRAEDWIRFEARSWYLTARIVWRIDDGHVWFATSSATTSLRPCSSGHRCQPSIEPVAPGFVSSGVARVERSRRT